MGRKSSYQLGLVEKAKRNQNRSCTVCVWAWA